MRLKALINGEDNSYFLVEDGTWPTGGILGGFNHMVKVKNEFLCSALHILSQSVQCIFPCSYTHCMWLVISLLDL